jgi:CheY-like chemotaxis protein
LLSVRQRVQQLNGSFEVNSKPTLGTTIGLVLPLASSTCASVEPPHRGSSDSEPHVGGGTDDIEVLLVDDDVEQAESLARVLRVSGIAVGTVESVEAALARLDGRNRSVVLCDVNMPDGGANLLLDKLKEQRLSVRIGVMSGEEDETLLYRFAARGVEAFFPKPADPSQLIRWLLPAPSNAD